MHVEVHGHRGARARFPENTMAAFRHAIEAGADYIELDVCVTRDNVVVACHDPVLKRRRCCGPPGTRIIRRMTLAHLREWDCGVLPHPRFPEQALVPGSRIPTLDEVFNLARSSPIRFNIEVKTSLRRPELTAPPDLYARLLAEAVHAHGLEHRVLIQAFDFRVLEELRAIAPEIPRAALYRIGWRDFVSVAELAQTRIVAPHYTLVTKRKVAAAHEAGLKVIPWTANRPRTWARLVRAGVDGIITDDPAGLVAFLNGTGA